MCVYLWLCTYFDEPLITGGNKHSGRNATYALTAAKQHQQHQQQQHQQQRRQQPHQFPSSGHAVANIIFHGTSQPLLLPPEVPPTPPTAPPAACVAGCGSAKRGSIARFRRTHSNARASIVFLVDGGSLLAPRPTALRVVIDSHSSARPSSIPWSVPWVHGVGPRAAGRGRQNGV